MTRTGNGPDPAAVSPVQEDPPSAAAPTPETLVVTLDGFDGPLDVLLALAREQKVDLARISVLRLAEQYLAFVRAARDRALDLAADYLVMAAWLAFLKSRLLLPVPKDDEAPSGAEMAAALQFQLQRLEAMRARGRALMERPRLGSLTFARGQPEAVTVRRQTVHALGFHQLLAAYAGLIRRKRRAAPLAVEPFDLVSVEEALTRLNRLLGTAVEWTELARFLPEDLDDPLRRRSAVGATFVAGLELARQGRAEVRQEGGAFGPLYLRHRDRYDP